MFQIDDDMTIYITRGDVAYFSVTADNNGVPYKFKPGDVVRIKVYAKKDATNVAFQKDFPVLEESEKVDILLTEAETKIGDVISKPVDYWYEIELNPYSNPQTIVGYDDDGAKIFKLFPEGRDLGPDTVPEDVPVVDSELSLTSQKPVENQAITRAMLKLREECSAIVVGDFEPQRSCLWFNTMRFSSDGRQYSALNLSDNTSTEVVANVDGQDYGVQNALLDEEETTAGTYNFDLI